MSEEKKPKNKALDNLWMALRRETRLKIFCQPVVKKYLSNPKLFKKKTCKNLKLKIQTKKKLKISWQKFFPPANRFIEPAGWVEAWHKNDIDDIGIRFSHQPAYWQKRPSMEFQQFVIDFTEGKNRKFLPFCVSQETRLLILNFSLLLFW